jgi:hypothetical protein
MWLKNVIFKCIFTGSIKIPLLVLGTAEKLTLCRLISPGSEWNKWKLSLCPTLARSREIRSGLLTTTTHKPEAFDLCFVLQAPSYPSSRCALVLAVPWLRHHDDWSKPYVCWPCCSTLTAPFGRLSRVWPVAGAMHTSPSNGRRPRTPCTCRAQGARRFTTPCTDRAHEKVTDRRGEKSSCRTASTRNRAVFAGTFFFLPRPPSLTDLFVLWIINKMKSRD